MQDQSFILSGTEWHYDVAKDDICEGREARWPQY